MLALLERDNVHVVVQSATSTGWNDRRYPNQIRVFGDRTAALKPFEDRQRWAQAVVRDDQCEGLEAALAGGEPVVVEFELRNDGRTAPSPQQRGGRPQGQRVPDEYVIVCAHLDSWHQATGATDNGTGTCSTLEAARLITPGRRAKRTIRFILWGGEEQGLLGSRQYVVQNRTRMHKVSAVFNHDSGTNWAHALTVAKSQKADFEALIAPILAAMQPPEADYGVPSSGCAPSRRSSQLAAAATTPRSPRSASRPSRGASPARALRARLVLAVGHLLDRAPRLPTPQRDGLRRDRRRRQPRPHALARRRRAREAERPRRRVDAKLIIETWLGLELDGMTIKAATADGVARGKLQAGDEVVAVGEEPVKTRAVLLAEFRSAVSIRSSCRCSSIVADVASSCGCGRNPGPGPLVALGRAATSAAGCARSVGSELLPPTLRRRRRGR